VVNAELKADKVPLLSSVCPRLTWGHDAWLILTDATQQEAEWQHAIAISYFE